MLWLFLRLLEAIRRLKIEKKLNYTKLQLLKFSEIQKFLKNEKTPFKPSSPYAISNLFAYWTVVNYREAYNIFAVNGILFNHESEKRGATFVTKKNYSCSCRLLFGKKIKSFISWKFRCKKRLGFS